MFHSPCNNLCKIPKINTRMYLPATFFILLSAGTYGGKTEHMKTCYWCGPLAEQVHRSQRAPPCTQQLQTTTCDEGYSHCAVVATSPPYAESRLCVKFYQDECYSLYCNSSKTWRMICPCQGNLCNGQNTDRETTAFATLAKIVGKNKRNKRSLIAAKKFISPRHKISNQTETENPMDGTTTDKPLDYSNVIESTSAMSNDVIEEGNHKDMDDNVIEQGEDSEMQGDQPVEEQTYSNEAVTPADDGINAEQEEVQHETTKTIGDVKMDSPTSPSQHETTKNINDVKMNSTPSSAMNKPEEIIIKNMAPTVNQFVKEIESVTDLPKLTSLIPTSIEIVLSVVHVKNPDNLPPPEALQQNVTPPAKVETPTTMDTIETTTNENHIETTTQPIKETVKKNIEMEITKNKDEEVDKNKKNGVEKSIVRMWALVLLMNVLVYLTF